MTIKGTGKARITISAPATSMYESASVVIIINVNKSDAPDVKINGTFTGSARGYGGPVNATVVIENSVMTKITLEGKKETKEYWTKAKKLSIKMISKQTWDVDAVSGATYSSNGIRNAVKQALEAAGLI